MANDRLEFDVLEFEHFTDHIMQELFILRDALIPIEKGIIHYLPRSASFDAKYLYVDRKATIKDAKSVAHHLVVRCNELINSLSKRGVGKLPEEK